MRSYEEETGELVTPTLCRKQIPSLLADITLKMVTANGCGSSMTDSNPDRMEAASTSKPSSERTPDTKATQKKAFTVICLGITYSIVSGLFFSMCGASVKYLEDLDPGQVAFYQYIAIVVFSLPMVVRSQENPFGPNRTCRFWMVICGICDAVTIYFSFLSFRYLPLSDATVLTSTVPVFVTISARIFLKEKCSTAQLVAIIVSVIGVALVSKVPLLLANRTDVYTRESVIGILAAIGSIISESGMYVILRKLHEVDVFVILFNFGWVACIVNAGLTVIFGSYTLTACGVEQVLVIAVGAFSFLSQMTLTKALEIEEAGPVSVLMAAGDIMMAFTLDLTLFKEKPDMYTISGTVLVILSVITVGCKRWFDMITKDISFKEKLLRYLFRR